MNALKNLFAFGSLAGAFALLMLVSQPAHPQATLNINYSASDIIAAQPVCQAYLNLSTTPSNAQLKQCAIIVLTRFMNAGSVATQSAAVSAVPFNPN